VGGGSIKRGHITWIDLYLQTVQGTVREHLHLRHKCQEKKFLHLTFLLLSTNELRGIFKVTYSIGDCGRKISREEKSWKA
jgi:hypothetical protein